MPKHSIILKREGIEGFLSSRNIGDDALDAMLSIPGVENPEIVSESKEQVKLTYSWTGNGTFWETNEYLLKFGLARADFK